MQEVIFLERIPVARGQGLPAAVSLAQRLPPHFTDKEMEARRKETTGLSP